MRIMSEAETIPPYQLSVTKKTDYICEFTLSDLTMPPIEYEPIITGSVKWDGCMNWSTVDGHAAHSCDEEDLKELASWLHKARVMALALL